MAMTEREGRELDILARGLPVPGHPGACASAAACWHGYLWHDRHGARRCQRPGCPCPGLVRNDQRRDADLTEVKRAS
jgi:hypothetical protein